MSRATAADFAGNPASVADTWWFYHGELEAGGRFFVNNPQKNGINSQGGQSLAKYYEYSTIKPGPFLYGYISAGTKDGLYKFDVWADNVGYSDQQYELNASKAGQHYFNFTWDQTPHIYGYGLTLYNGVGTNDLTLPSGLAATLNADCNNLTGANCANKTKAQTDINKNLHQTDIGIRRDTATVEYRWTPTDAWDVNVNYTNIHRSGSQVEGVAFGPNTSSAIGQVPRPIDDTTQNYGINGEYAGNSPWGQKFTFKVGYNGSTFRNEWDSYTVEDPFCPPGLPGGGLCGPGGGAGTGNGGANFASSALVSLAPNNQANGVTATLGADLPWKSRYMGTVSYTMMRQNEAFLPFTNNPTPRLAGNPTPLLPASSLDGGINTLLSNNVVTTQITPDLKTKLSYRYYDFDNQTPELLFNDWIVTDTTSANNRNTTYAPVHSISISYTKQNAGAEVNWQPTRQWNLGLGYLYERYNWTRADVNITNENAIKAFADWKPYSWLTARATWTYGVRHYENYDYLNFVGNFQWPEGATNTRYASAFRMYMLNNRNQDAAKFSLETVVLPGMTITPTFALLNSDYKINPNFEEGLNNSHSWKAGVELAYAMNPNTTFLFAYMYEHYNQSLNANTTNPYTPTGNFFTTDVVDNINTYMAAINYAVIPNRFDIRLSYSLSNAKDSQPISHLAASSATLVVSQYPDVTTHFQRFEALGKYKFDEDFVHRLGLKGDVYAKLRYVWERNAVVNWQNDVMAPYMNSSLNTTLGTATWLAYDNPNYNVQLIAASLAYKW